MRRLLLLLAFLAACAPTGGIPRGGANSPDPSGGDDDDATGDDDAIDSTEVDGWSDNLSALFTLYDDEWLLVIADDGDICIDGAGGPSAIYVWGLPFEGGTFDVDELTVHGCDWLGQADTGTITFGGVLPDFSGEFEFHFGSVVRTGQFVDPERCTDIPDWG